MKVKVRNLIELILQILIPILTFIPGYYSFNFYSAFPSVPVFSGPLPYYDAAFNPNSFYEIVCGIGLYLVIILGIALYIKQYISTNENRNMGLTVIVSSLELILYSLFSLRVLVGNDKAFKLYFMAEILFFVLLVLFLALTAITLWGYLKAKKDGIIEETPKTVRTIIEQSPSSADELKKYKELLDSGIITQEEFDAKKAQLLGL